MVGGHCPAHWGMPDAHRFGAAHRGPAQDADTAREHQGEKADTAAQQDDLDTAAPDIAAKTCPDTAVRIGPGIAAMASQRSTDAATGDASAGAERSCAELPDEDCSDAGPSIRREAGPARGWPQRPRRRYVPRLCRPCSSPLSCSAPARSFNIQFLLDQPIHCAVGSSEFGSSVMASLGLSEIASS
jgi:hypothetical protein